jgi:hypothetical protein
VRVEVDVKRSESDLPTLHFRGAPRALDSLVSLAYDEVGPAPRISIADRKAIPFLRGVFAFDVGGKASRLHLSFSEATPPGTYKGSAEMAGKSFPVEIHVEPYIHLTLSPRQLVLDGYSGQKQQVDLTLGNSGNVPCEVGSTYVFGLYDVDGAERGIAAAFRQSEVTGEKRLERMMEELAEGHGGLVRVQVEEGQGPIAPGEVRPLRLHLHLPAGLKGGHTYTGTLALENLQYYVKVRAAAETK